MNKNSSLTRNGLSVHQLKMEMKVVSDFAERDKVELGTVGVTAEMPASLKQKAIQLEDLRLHEFWIAKKKVLTLERNTARKFVKQEVYMIREQLSDVINVETGFYNSLFDKRFSSANIGEFIKIADNVYAALVENAEFITLQGVSPQQVANFKTLIDNLKSLEESKFNAEKHLQTITSDRNEEIDSAYRFLKRIAGLGKAYWRYRNPARSAEYSIKAKSRAKTVASDEDS